MTGPQFFRLAWRVSAYEGVITMRLREQQKTSSAPSAPPSYAEPAAPAPAAASVAEHHEVSLDQFCLLFPGTVSRSVVSASG
jgi:hypothetical protein